MCAICPASGNTTAVAVGMSEAACSARPAGKVMSFSPCSNRIGRPAADSSATGPVSEGARGHRQHTAGGHDQAGDPFRRGHEQALGDQPAVGESENRRRRDIQVVQEGEQVADHRVGRVLPVSEPGGRPAAAAQIRQHNAKAPVELGQRLAQVGVIPIGPSVGHQEHPARRVDTH